MDKKIIGYVSKTNPFQDRVAWSGTIYKLREAIELAGYEVIWIPYGDSLLTKFYTYLLKIFNHTLFIKKHWLVETHFTPLVKVWARNINRNPILSKCDYLFFPRGAQIALYLGVNKPIIYFTAATAHVMFDYYWYNINRFSKKMALDLEERASQNASINIKSSRWAFDSVINDCHCYKDKCHVLEFGPNIDAKDIKQNTLYENGELRIFFSGVDWERKGGDIAVKTVEILRDKGMDVQLNIAGIRKMPTSCIGKDYIHFHGFLNKNNPDDYKRICELYSQNHIFLLPTKAECSAIVYCEASAAGLPIYTYLTGGTGDYVIEGVNGHALPLGSPAESFANQIYNDIKTNQLYSLREGALKVSKEKLSWEAWAKGFREIMERVSIIPNL